MQTKLRDCRNPETRLILKAQSGDKRALDEVMLKYKGLIDYQARKYAYVPGYSWADLVQLGRIGAYQAILRYDPAKNCALSTTLYNRVRRSLEKAFMVATGSNTESRKRRKFISSPLQHDEGVEFYQGSAEDPENVVILRDEVHRLLQQVEPASAQALVYLSHGYEYADIAEMTGEEEKAIRLSVIRARRLLQERFLEYV